MTRISNTLLAATATAFVMALMSSVTQVLARDLRSLQQSNCDRTSEELGTCIGNVEFPAKCSEIYDYWSAYAKCYSGCGKELIRESLKNVCNNPDAKIKERLENIDSCTVDCDNLEYDAASDDGNAADHKTMVGIVAIGASILGSLALSA